MKWILLLLLSSALTFSSCSTKCHDCTIIYSDGSQAFSEGCCEGIGCADASELEAQKERSCFPCSVSCQRTD